MDAKELLDPPVEAVMDDENLAKMLHDGTKVGFTLTDMFDRTSIAPRINILRKLAQDIKISVFVKFNIVNDFAAALVTIMELAGFCKDIRIDLLAPYRRYHYDWQHCDRFIDHLTALSNKEGIQVQWGPVISQFYKEQRPHGLQKKLRHE